jgi:hypothetical protein
VTVFYATVLYGGIFAILASIEAFICISLSVFIFIDLFFAVIGLVAVRSLSGFFSGHDEEKQAGDYHVVWKTVFPPLSSCL